jgi:hypothetical protein
VDATATATATADSLLLEELGELRSESATATVKPLDCPGLGMIRRTSGTTTHACKYNPSALKLGTELALFWGGGVSFPTPPTHPYPLFGAELCLTANLVYWDQSNAHPPRLSSRVARNRQLDTLPRMQRF